jgi:hypothetical protein
MELLTIAIPKKLALSYRVPAMMLWDQGAMNNTSRDLDLKKSRNRKRKKKSLEI